MKRKQLRAFNSTNRPAYVVVENPFTSFKTTEVHVTSEPVDLPLQDTSNILGKIDGTGSSPAPGQYSVTINCSSPPMTSPPLSPMVWASSNAPPSRRSDLQRRSNRAAMEANTAAWSYTKCAILFFISLLVTWVPSSINRVYSLIHPELISIPFTYASAIVLPLMGFWNSVIYITTSWAACKTLFGINSKSIRQRTMAARRLPRTMIEAQPGIVVRKSRADSISDSMRGLAIPYGA